VVLVVCNRTFFNGCEPRGINLDISEHCRACPESGEATAYGWSLAVHRVHGWRALYKSRPAKLQTTNDSSVYVRDSDSRLTIWQESGPYCSTIISSIAYHRGARRVFARSDAHSRALDPLEIGGGALLSVDRPGDRWTRCERRAVMHCHAPTPFARSSSTRPIRNRVEPKFKTVRLHSIRYDSQNFLCFIRQTNFCILIVWLLTVRRTSESIIYRPLIFALTLYTCSLFIAYVCLYFVGLAVEE